MDFRNRPLAGISCIYEAVMEALLLAIVTVPPRG